MCLPFQPPSQGGRVYPKSSRTGASHRGAQAGLGTGERSAAKAPPADAGSTLESGDLRCHGHRQLSAPLPGSRARPRGPEQLWCGDAELGGARGQGLRSPSPSRQVKEKSAQGLR